MTIVNFRNDCIMLKFWYYLFVGMERTWPKWGWQSAKELLSALVEESGLSQSQKKVQHFTSQSLLDDLISKNFLLLYICFIFFGNKQIAILIKTHTL